MKNGGKNVGCNNMERREGSASIRDQEQAKVGEIFLMTWSSKIDGIGAENHLTRKFLGK